MVEDKDRRPHLGPLYLGMAMVTMADTILTIAMPSIVAELGGARSYTALVTAYLLPQALATPVGGRLVDQYRPRLVVAITCVLYLAATLGAALASSMEVLLLFRVLQGLGGGALQASIYGTLDLLVPPREQGQVQANAAMVLGGGAMVAPLLGGLLTDLLGWRWCFFINLPAGLICLLYLTQLPDLAPRGKGRLDIPGVLLLSMATVPLMMAFTLGGVRMPWKSPLILSLLVVAALFAALFWQVEAERPEPLFDPKVLHGGVFSWAALAYFCMGGAFLSCLIYVPLVVQVVRLLTPLEAGLALLPFIVGNVVGAVLQGSLVKSYGRYRIFALVGSGSTMVAFLLATWAASVGLQKLLPLELWAFLVGLLGFTFGLGWDMYTLAVQNDTPASRQGMAGSAMDFIRQMGGALGIALVGSFMIWSLDAYLPPELDRHLRPLGIDVDVSSFTDEATLKELTRTFLKAVKVEAERALQGDEHAYRRLRVSIDLTPDLERRIRDRDVNCKAELDAELEAAALKADHAVQLAYIQALRDAQCHVYALEAFLCGLAFLAACRLPDRPLRETLLDL